VGVLASCALVWRPQCVYPAWEMCGFASLAVNGPRSTAAVACVCRVCSRGSSSLPLRRGCACALLSHRRCVLLYLAVDDV
jgi:hypothetical protein